MPKTELTGQHKDEMKCNFALHQTEELYLLQKKVLFHYTDYNDIFLFFIISFNS